MRKAAHLLKLAVTVLCCVLVGAQGCKQEKKEQAAIAAPAASKAGHTFAVKGSVREMSITPEVTNFPDGEGKNEFMSYCSMCHSLRYISMQPDFSKKIWEEEVHKMVAKYNAPIDSVTCNKIVSYLLAVKGAK